MVSGAATSSQIEAELQRQARETAKQNIEWEKQQERIRAEEAKLRSGGSINRTSQGMKGVGSGFAPALRQGAGAAATGVAQGAGAAVGWAGANLVAQPAKGFLGWFINFWPENIYGWFVWGAAITYFLDWKAGFSVSATGNWHLGFAIVAFLIIGLTQKMLSGIGILSSSMFFMALIGFMNAGSTQQKGYAVVAIVLASFLYSRLNAPGFFKLLPVIAVLDVYGMPLLRDWSLSVTANVSYLSFFTTFLMNRILFPIWLWFAGLGLYNNTRVARRALGLILVFYFVVSLPAVTSAYKARVSELTPEETEVASGIWERFQANMRQITSGEFLKTPMESVYERAEMTFGFGTPKEQPKMGLKVSPVRQQQLFDVSYKKIISPSAILEVPNPFPAEFSPDKRHIKVTGVGCQINNDKGSADGTVTDPGRGISEESPVLIFGDTSKRATCEFRYDDPKVKAAIKEGSNDMELVVKYKFDADSDMKITFMPADALDEELLRKEIRTVVSERGILPHEASYDNFPVSIMWPEEFDNFISGFDMENPPAMGVYIADSGTWPGEIYGIRKLELVLPDGFSLDIADEDRCDFEPTGIKGVYTVKKALINEEATGEYRLIGDKISFHCGLNMDRDLFSKRGGVVPASFKARGEFIFGTKETIRFEVKGKEKPDAK